MLGAGDMGRGMAAMLGEADGGARDDNDDERGSPSPVIIWRHAAPVKLAEYFKLDRVASVGQIMDRLAEKRAQACKAAPLHASHSTVGVARSGLRV